MELDMKKLLFPLIAAGALYSAEYYVAQYGEDYNPGTFDSPFLTIQQAAETMSAGDICYIRQGLYHETVTMDDHDGAEGSPIVFTNYNNERVAMDGTVLIDSIWEVHSGNIWKTALDYDVWQLFVDWNEMAMARWPNANFEDGSVWDKENHWGHGTIDEDSEAYENGTLIDAPNGDVDLAGSGLDIIDAIAILNVGSFKTWTRRVLTHSGNTFTYDPVPGWKTKHHDYFLEGMLEFLDAETEWFFDIETKMLYFWAPNAADPNELHIRGKVKSYAFEISNSDHVQIKNLEFFGTTFKFDNCDYALVDGCNLFYSSCYKRMLGVVDTQPEMSIFTSSSNCVVSNSAFRYTDGSALEMYSGTNKIEECYFYHIDYTSTDLNGLMTTIQMGGAGNIFRRNTLHKLGASATLNPGDEALIELNDMYDSGYMQSDGALVQCMVGQQPGVEIRYNWLHDTIKYGARFDGNGDGNNGLMHHNVIWNVIGGIMIKGFEHNLYNNTAFDNGDKNDIIVMIDQGGNEGTITRNNAANKISGHRSGTYQDYPVPGIYDHNWNGYETGKDVKDLLLDPENHDFRPHPDSALVDAGITAEGISDDYVGDAPDLGAYENGGEFWIPGITWDVSSTFGDYFDPPEPIHNGPVWHVATTGSDGNDGSEESPFATIQHGIDVSTDGDSVSVSAGNYVENINYNGKNIAVIGEDWETTIIDGGEVGSVVTISSSSESATLEGFTIHNGQSSSGGGVYIDSSTVFLHDMRIENNTSQGQGGGVYISSSDIDLNDVTIGSNHAMGDGGGVYIYSNSNVDFSECIITENTCDDDGGGLKIHNTCSVMFSNSELTANTSADKGGAIVANDYSDLTFDSSLIADNNALYGAAFRLRTGTILNLSNSVVSENTAEVSGSVVYAVTSCSLNVSHSTITANGNDNNDDSNIFLAESYFAQIDNSIIWNEDEIEIDYDNSGVLEIEYSDIQGGWEGDGNINSNPLFCNADSTDFTVAENSPCVGTGENGSNMGAFGVGCGPYNFSPTEFSLSTPSNNAQITIDDSNMNDGFITFSWDESSDENGDSLVYLMHATSTEIGDFSLDTNITYIDISYMDLIENMTENNTTFATIEWTVDVTDGIDTVTADNAPFSLNVDGSDALSSLVEKLIPEVFALHQNYPNPFNPVTTLQYDLPEDALVNITIYDMMGRQVKTLINGSQTAGYKTIQWDATNNFGEPVSAGLYLYTIEAGEFRQTKKMILLK